MTAADREQIRELIRDMADLKGRELTPGMLELYVDSLGDIQPERVRRALAQWLRISQYFPQPNEILDTNATLPLTAGEEDQAQQRLLARIDWTPKLLASYLTSTPEELAKLAAPSDTEAAKLLKEALETPYTVRQMSRAQFSARIAELERQKQLLLSQARVTELQVETEKVISRATENGAPFLESGE